MEAAPASDPGVSIDLFDSMSMIYSSGTTGVPKGIEHTHYARLMSTIQVRAGAPHRSLRDDDLYNAALYERHLDRDAPDRLRGPTVVLVSRFAPDVFQAVGQKTWNPYLLVPTQSVVLLEYAGSRIRPRPLDARAPLWRAAAQQCHIRPAQREHSRHMGIYEVYGMTEGFVTVALPEDWERGRRGSVGVPLYACDVGSSTRPGTRSGRARRGRCSGYSPGLMKGYRGAPELTQELIWHGPRNRTYVRSGDIGRVDEDGYVYVERREGHDVDLGGLNVFASDVEEVCAFAHPDVVEVAAVAVPHPSGWRRLCSSRSCDQEAQLLRAADGVGERAIR